MARVLQLHVNGAMRSIAAEPDTLLLYVLTDEVGFAGATVRMWTRSMRVLLSYSCVLFPPLTFSTKAVSKRLNSSGFSIITKWPVPATCVCE